MQIYTITREKIERYKQQNHDHGLPDNIDWIIVAVAYDRADNRAINAVTGIRWIDAKMCDADDNVVDMANVPKRTVFRLVTEHQEMLQMRKAFDKRREARTQEILQRMGAL